MFAAYVRKTARLRDKADVLVREIGMYADTETPNLKRGMKQFADHLAKVEDYRQAEVKPVLLPLLSLKSAFHIHSLSLNAFGQKAGKLLTSRIGPL